MSRAPRVVAAVVDRVRVALANDAREVRIVASIDGARFEARPANPDRPTDRPTRAADARAMARDGAGDGASRARARARTCSISTARCTRSRTGTRRRVDDACTNSWRRGARASTTSRRRASCGKNGSRGIIKRCERCDSGAGYEFDAAEYWRFTRGDAREHLAPSADVRAFVESLPGGRENKYVFTNCNETQALEALEALGLRDCFADRVFGAGGMGECCKPEREAFEKFFAFCGVDVADASECVFFEDSLKNLRAAKEIFGMTTVLVAGETFYEEMRATRDAETDVADAAPSYVDLVPSYVDLVVRGGELTERAVARALRDAPSAARCRVALGLDA